MPGALFVALDGIVRHRRFIEIDSGERGGGVVEFFPGEKLVSRGFVPEFNE